MRPPLRYVGNNVDFVKPENVLNETDNLISKTKKKYYRKINRKLTDQQCIMEQPG